MSRRGLRERIIWATGLQLLLVSTAVGGMAFFTGQSSGLSQAEAYRQQAAITDFSEQLSKRLEAPRLINTMNVIAVQQGQMSLADFDAMGKRFWRLMQLYPVGYINYGNTAGEFLGVERLDDGTLVLNEDAFRSPLGRGTMGVYALDGKGQRGRLLEAIPGMTTSHEEAWYVETVKAGKPTWSSIYQWEDKPEVLAISYNEPLYGPGRRLLGVIGVDFVLSQLNTWLAELWQGKDGFALIVEPDGMVVASSRAGFSRRGSGANVQRVRFDQLNDPVAQQISRRFFRKQPDGSLKLQMAGPGTIDQGDHCMLVAVKLWGQAEGLNWRLITAIRADGTLHANQRYGLIALLLSLAAVGTAVVVSIRMTNWLLGPLEVLRQRCQQASKQVAEGNTELLFNPRLNTGVASEIEAVSAAFSALVERLTQARRQLAEAIERERLKDAQTVLVLEEKLKSSLQAAAVAHEINLPLSTLLLNSKLLLNQGDTPLPGPLQESLQSIATHADAVVTTIEKMRTLLRNVQTNHAPINLAQVARSALLYVAPSLKAAGVEVQRQGLDTAQLDTSKTVMGDGAQIQIAVVNLLRNALEALETRPEVSPELSPEQAPAGPPTIVVGLRREGNTVVLAVADNGPGFADPTAALTPLATSKAQGSGLGLFVVQTTMENHRGSLTIGRSSLGGAEVRLIFPAGDSDPQSLPTGG